MNYEPLFNRGIQTRHWRCSAEFQRLSIICRDGPRGKSDVTAAFFYRLSTVRQFCHVESLHSEWLLSGNQAMPQSRRSVLKTHKQSQNWRDERDTFRHFWTRYSSNSLRFSLEEVLLLPCYRRAQPGPAVVAVLCQAQSEVVTPSVKYIYIFATPFSRNLHALSATIRYDQYLATALEKFAPE